MRTRLEKTVALLQRGNLEKAEAQMRSLARERPGEPAVLHLMGLIKLRRGKTGEAVRLLESAVAAAPRVGEYHANLAEAYHRAGEFDRAEAECQLALRCDPRLPHPMNLLGLVHVERRDYEKALQCFSAAMRLETPFPDAMINSALVLLRTGEYELARDACELVLRIVPGHPLALTNLGMAYKGMRRYEDAKAAFEEAGDFPRARFNLGFVHLLEDDLARGLPLYEHRKQMLGLGRGLGKPEWQGEPHPARTLLVVPEQGMGDTILMSRFYPALLERFARVVAQVQEPLARLIRTASPGVDVVTDLAGVDFDYWCPTMSLPYRLGIDSVEKIPNRPWLDVPALAERRARRRVGLNWAGNPSFAYDAVRSTRLESLEMFLRVGDVEWVSLHKGHLEHEAEARGLPQPLQDARDFYDTAVVVKGLDLVISTETAIPNLSAAMGVRTCVLANPDVDWRWKSWYPGVTICAQETPGNWFGPIARALEVIRDLVADARAA